MLHKTKIFFGSLLIAVPSFFVASGTTQAAQTAPAVPAIAQTLPTTETMATCYPATSCDDDDTVTPDNVYTVPNIVLKSLAEQEGITTGSFTADALIGIGASAINPWVGGAGTLIIAAINDGIANRAELAQTTLDSGKDLVVAVKENPSGYPALEILSISLE